jgi:ankyrin repeat protein
MAMAAMKGRLEVVALLSERGASLGDERDSFFSPLSLAAENRHWEVLRWLLEHGAEGDFGAALYWCAVHRGGTEGAGWLLDAGAPMTSSCGHALTAAIKHNNGPVARLLLERGARPEELNESDAERLRRLLSLEKKRHPATSSSRKP